MSKCEDCAAWHRITPIEKVEYIGGGRREFRYPIARPWDGECHKHAPAVLPFTSGSISGTHPYGDGSSCGGGGSYGTSAVTAFPKAKSDSWCCEFVGSDYVDILFDGPPSHVSGRFVEVNDSSGKSIKFGEWLEYGEGFWTLRIPRA